MNAPQQNQARFAITRIFLALTVSVLSVSIHTNSVCAQISDAPQLHYHEDFVMEYGEGEFTEWECNCGNGFCSRPKHFSRTPPPGTLNQRFPYDALRFYYYDRPYNAFQVDRRFENQLSRPARPRHPYSKQLFSSIYEQVEQQIHDSRYLDGAEITSLLPTEAIDEQVTRDRNLEYADWRAHRRARLDWEQEQLLVEEEQRSLESRPELRDVSHPARKRP